MTREEIRMKRVCATKALELVLGDYLGAVSEDMEESELRDMCLGLRYMSEAMGIDWRLYDVDGIMAEFAKET